MPLKGRSVSPRRPHLWITCAAKAIILYNFSQAELIIPHVFISFRSMEEGGQDSERTRAMRQGEAKNLLKCEVGKHLLVYSWNSGQVEAETLHP